jgi:hypothetical protein
MLLSNPFLLFFTLFFGAKNGRSCTATPSG